jgi:hypothetical protein
LKSRASPDIFHFSFCKKKGLAIRHMNRPPFPMTLSIPSYDIGNYVGLRTYQHTLVNVAFMAVLLYFLRSSACITELCGNVRKVFSCAVILNFYGICIIQTKLIVFLVAQQP